MAVNRQSVEAAGGTIVASFPWWVHTIEAWIIQLGAVCGASLAIARVAQLLWIGIRRRTIPPIDPE